MQNGKPVIKKDTLFQEQEIETFEFNQAVAAVFDDMLDRSIPFYREVIALMCEYIAHNAKEGMEVVDLGCSTGTFLMALERSLDTPKRLIGIDNSEPMLEIARQKAKAYGVQAEFILADIVSHRLNGCDVVVSNYTLQFIKPHLRREVVKNIYKSLRRGGIFIFSEKIVFDDRRFDEQITSIYYRYKKRQGYSDLEIAKKKQALEDVLIPFTLQQNIQMAKEAGFERIDTLFQWANFVTFIAGK